MSFRPNQSQQISFEDSFLNLTEREKKAMKNSWAEAFSKEVFPNIREEPFSVLYSDNDASCPNTPINIIIGALIIKEMFGCSDDDMVENTMLDLRYQYALHTTSFKEQPLSDKSLTRFRTKCYQYETATGVDLLQDCIRELASHIAKVMKIDGHIRRMDSTMIAANIRKFSRMELIYTCIANLVKYLKKADIEFDQKRLAHYLDPDDFNKVIYHSKGEDADHRIQTLLEDTDLLMEVCGDACADISEYQLFARCMSEQTVVEEDTGRRLKTKEDGGMDSNILQNPADPDATFREKAGKEYRGYVANIEESVGTNGSVVTDYQFEKNNVSDDAMFKEYLKNLDQPSKETTIITDGAYGSVENIELAQDKKVELVPTDLSGKETDPIMADFQFNEDFTKVIACPAGHAPKSCSYNKKTGQCTVSFEIGYCANCPFKEQCNPTEYTRVARKTVSRKSVVRANYIKEKGTERFKYLARLRNGVETIPSILKNLYGANRMPVRGLQRSKFFFGCKIGALNFKKLLSYRRGTGHYAENPLLA